MDHRSEESLVIDENGNKLGKMLIVQAKQIAKNAGLDLVEVHNKDNVSVCKIMDEGKWKYDQKKKSQKNKQHHLPPKEVKFRVRIESHDQETKSRQVKKFLEKGHKVKIVVQSKGREIVANPQAADEKMKDILSKLEGYKYDESYKSRDKRGEKLEVFVYPVSK